MAKTIIVQKDAYNLAKGKVHYSFAFHLHTCMHLSSYYLFICSFIHSFTYLQLIQFWIVYIERHLNDYYLLNFQKKIFALIIVLQNGKKCFLFHHKSRLRSQHIQSFLLTFWSCRKNGLIRKIRLISKFMMSQPG